MIKKPEKRKKAIVLASHTNTKKRHVNHDGQERIRYLYDAAIKMYNITRLKSLSQHYIKTMLEVGRKTMTRLTLEMKRSICKKCFMPLIPGRTCTNSIKIGKNLKWLRIKCLACDAGHSILQGNDKKKEKEKKKKKIRMTHTNK